MYLISQSDKRVRLQFLGTYQHELSKEIRLWSKIFRYQMNSCAGMAVRIAYLTPHWANRCSNPDWGQKIFLFSINFQTGSGAHPASHAKGYFPEVKRPARDADHSPGIADDKIEWNHICAPLTCRHATDRHI